MEPPAGSRVCGSQCTGYSPRTAVEVQDELCEDVATSNTLMPDLRAWAKRFLEVTLRDAAKSEDRARNCDLHSRHATDLEEQEQMQLAAKWHKAKADMLRRLADELKSELGV